MTNNPIYSAALKAAADVVRNTRNEREADLRRKKADFNRGAVDGLMEALAGINALPVPDIREALAGMVRKLEWRKRTDGGALAGLHDAVGTDGWCYNVWELPDGSASYEGDPVKLLAAMRNIPGQNYHTLEAAKAAAQSDYAARVLAGLDMGEGK